MDSTRHPVEHASRDRHHVLLGSLHLFGAEALCSIAGTLLSIGTSFYMKDRFGWGMRQNFMLAAAQGLAYVPGALSAGRMTRWLGRGGTLFAAYAVLTILSVVAWRS